MTESRSRLAYGSSYTLLTSYLGLKKWREGQRHMTEAEAVAEAEVILTRGRQSEGVCMPGCTLPGYTPSLLPPTLHPAD